MCPLVTHGTCPQCGRSLFECKRVAGDLRRCTRCHILFRETPDAEERLIQTLYSKSHLLAGKP